MCNVKDRLQNFIAQNEGLFDGYYFFVINITNIFKLMSNATQHFKMNLFQTNNLNIDIMTAILKSPYPSAPHCS